MVVTGIQEVAPESQKNSLIKHLLIFFALYCTIGSIVKKTGVICGVVWRFDGRGET